MLDFSYAPFIAELRFETNRYVWRQEAHAIRWLHVIMRDGKNPRRRCKFLRTALRNLALSIRLCEAEDTGRRFDVRFTPAKRDRLFAVLPNAMSEITAFDGGDAELLETAYHFVRNVELGENL